MTKEEYLRNAEGIYKSTRGLFGLTPKDRLHFKPMPGTMTVAQVLKHCAHCLGEMAVMGIQEKWPQLPEDQMLPPAEAMPVADSVDKVIEELDKDWALMRETFKNLSEEDFNSRLVKAPWEPKPRPLVDFMMQTMEHLSNHRMQLFIWLKLAGEKLDTSHLYGMTD